MSAQHTPGPWRVSLTDDTVVVDATGHEVAAIDGDYNDPDTWPLMEANARLIAAAPDLLAALRELAAVFAEDGPAYEALLEAEYEDAANSERHPSFKHVRDTVLAKARAAIAKAEGQP